MAATELLTRESQTHDEPGARPKRWTLDEYHRFVELGIFNPAERLELIRGEIIEKMPQNPPHAAAITLLLDTLPRCFGKGWLIRPQLPLTLPQDSEPEPDIAIVRGAPLDYLGRHPLPADVALVIEVSDTTLQLDTVSKSALYARDGVPEYWIVNLRQQHVEVRREPAAVSEAPFGHAYKASRIYTPDDVIHPLARPGKGIRTASLLPPTAA